MLLVLTAATDAGNGQGQQTLCSCQQGAAWVGLCFLVGLQAGVWWCRACCAAAGGCLPLAWDKPCSSSADVFCLLASQPALDLGLCA